MSCITQLLQMKGDKECLPIHNNAVIENGGTYKDYEYLITITSRGTRCGYVAIKELKDYINYECFIDCHGGVTFFGDDHSAKDLLPVKCTDTWIGFDAAHSNDKSDVGLIEKYFNGHRVKDDMMDFLNIMDCASGGSAHRTYDYMENECKDIIDQLIGLEEQHGNI
jgi:hypothetical protein